MSKFKNIKKGDQVRIVIEGNVDYVNSDGLTPNIEVGYQDIYDNGDGSLISVEVLAPPPPKWTDGDVIREVITRGTVYVWTRHDGIWKSPTASINVDDKIFDDQFAREKDTLTILYRAEDNA